MCTRTLNVAITPASATFAVCIAAQHSLNPELEAARPSTAGEEELQLQLALAMSKEEAEEDERKKRSDDVKLHLALEESKKEDVSINSTGDS